MDLRYEKKLSFGCYVCGHAGEDLVLWPQDPRKVPERVGGSAHQESWLPGEWSVYVTSYDPKQRSGRKSVDVCLEHYNTLGADWIAIAQSEIDLENQWHSYMERVER